MIGFRARIKSKAVYFRKHIARIYKEAAIVIQKNVKRFITKRKFKRIIRKEKMYPCVKWRYGGKVAYVIGDMIKPQWIHKMKLKLCPLRGIHYKYIKTSLDSRKQYRYLFIVDGKYCFDASLPCVGGGTQHITNCLLPKSVF